MTQARRNSLPGEHSGEVAREYVNKVCSLLEGNFGFHVYQTCYEAPDAASVVVGGERIRFDIIVDQARMNSSGDTETSKLHFLCECKWRTNTDDLKTQLKDFMKKALKTTPELQRQFSDRFGFLFFCNKPFGIDQSNLQDVSYIKEFLNKDSDSNDLVQLSRRIAIVFLSDWFLETTSRGRVR